MALYRIAADIKAFPQRLLMGLIRVYQIAFSPWLGSHCRFFPSCSSYALEALDQHGALGGTYLTTARLLRCHPFCKGGHDPVPGQLPRLFSIWSSSHSSRSPSPKRNVS
ncbi:MAG: membrane protein insertion efficiency factor YidD [Burkholderiales bacterium]